MANRAISALYWQLCNYFPWANCWNAHRIVFGAMVPSLEHKLMLIFMIWRFQKCYYERWNRSGTLESSPGDGCRWLLQGSSWAPPGVLRGSYWAASFDFFLQYWFLRLRRTNQVSLICTFFQIFTHCLLLLWIKFCKQKVWKPCLKKYCFFMFPVEKITILLKNGNTFFLQLFIL